MGQNSGHEAERVDHSCSAGESKCVQLRSLVAIFLWAVVFVLVLEFFQAATFLLLGLIASAALAAALRPLAERIPGPSAVGAVVTTMGFFIIFVGLLVLVGWWMYAPTQDNLASWPEVRGKINDLMTSAAGAVGYDEEVTVEIVIDQAGRLLTGSDLKNWLTIALSATIGTVLAILIVLIAAMYFLAQSTEELIGPLVKLLPPDRQEPMRNSLCELDPKFRWWAIGTSFSMSIIGVTSGLGFWIIGLPLALPLGVFAGIAQIVPTFGPMITLILAMLVAATQGWFAMIGVLIIYVVVQTIESYFLTPMVMKKAVNIPPVVTLFTVVLWGNLFGLPGLLLAIPLDLAIWSLLKHHIIRRHEAASQAQPSKEDG